MKFVNNIYFKIVFSFILVAIVGVIVWLLLTSLRAHQLTTNADVARKAGKPIPVSTVLVELGRLDAVTSAECKVKESARVALSKDTSGSVVKVNVKVGDTVIKGQDLIKLDDGVLTETLKNTQEAETTLLVLRDELIPFISDLRALRKNNLIPISTLLDAIDMQRRAELDLIRVRREKFSAEYNISNTLIVAPISGVLTSLDVFTGSVLRPYQEFLVLSQLDPILLECQFAEDSLSAINNFDQANATFPAHSNKVVSVQLENILPTADADSNAIIARFSLPNKEHALLPGMASVVRLNKLVEGVKVPSVSLINRDGDSANLFIVDDKKVARLLNVQVGHYAQGYVEVKSGLSHGQRVVIAGQGSLQDGDKVNEGNSKGAKVGIMKTLFRKES